MKPENPEPEVAFVPSERLSASVPTRRWEFLYRLLETGGAAILDADAVKNRRMHAGVTDHPDHHNYAWEESLAMGPEAERAANEAARAWCDLFDQWGSTPEHGLGYRPFTFPDVYALGFFLAVLHASDTVFYRGQSNANWTLMTSRSRHAAAPDRLAELDTQAASFRDHLRSDPRYCRFYEGAPPAAWHIEAACQHYGFPTHYLDFTTDFEVAAYFAEGASDHIAPAWSDPTCTTGAVYALPAALLPIESTRLVVLPPCFPRPRLQRGVFIEADPERVGLPSFEAAKYFFRHGPFPLRAGLGRLTWGRAPGLTEFYLPRADRYAHISSELRGDIFEDFDLQRWYRLWVQETQTLCFFDRGPGRMWVNDHHLRLRCRCEPVLASRGFVDLLERVAAHHKPEDAREDSVVRFFLTHWAAAMLEHGNIPAGMRHKVSDACKRRASLVNLPAQS